MKTRDEIISAVKQLRFSSRDCFYSILDQFTRQMPNGELVKVKWPEALNVLTIEQWNQAYTASMEMCQDMKGYRPPENLARGDGLQ
jgi:hypothetical protein